MKLLLRLGVIVALVAFGYSFVSENWDAFKNILSVSNPGEEVDLPVGVQNPPVTETKTELDAIFTYLPFLGFKFDDVVPVDGSDLYAVAGKRFVYQTNVLEVYQLESSASANDLIAQVKDNMKITRKINGKNEEFLAIALNSYLCLVVDVNDPVALLESYELAKETMKNLGTNFE